MCVQKVAVLLHRDIHFWGIASIDGSKHHTKIPRGPRGAYKRKPKATTSAALMPVLQYPLPAPVSTPQPSPKAVIPAAPQVPAEEPFRPARKPKKVARVDQSRRVSRPAHASVSVAVDVRATYNMFEALRGGASDDGSDDGDDDGDDDGGHDSASDVVPSGEVDSVSEVPVSRNDDMFLNRGARGTASKRTVKRRRPSSSARPAAQPPRRTPPRGRADRATGTPPPPRADSVSSDDAPHRNVADTAALEDLVPPDKRRRLQTLLHKLLGLVRTGLLFPIPVRNVWRSLWSHAITG